MQLSYEILVRTWPWIYSLIHIGRSQTWFLKKTKIFFGIKSEINHYTVLISILLVLFDFIRTITRKWASCTEIFPICVISVNMLSEIFYCGKVARAQGTFPRSRFLKDKRHFRLSIRSCSVIRYGSLCWTPPLWPFWSISITQARTVSLNCIDRNQRRWQHFRIISKTHLRRPLSSDQIQFCL